MAILKKGRAKSVLESGTLLKSKVKYRLVLLTKDGKRAELKKATQYSLFYGKKRILSGNIPKARKTVPRKRDFLFSIVTRVEKKRLQIIKSREFQRERKRKKLRKIKRNEGIRQIQTENLHKAFDFHSEEFERLKSSMFRAKAQIAKEELDLSYISEERPETLVSATLEYVIRIPFIPKSDEYRKEWIQKKISSEEGQYILDLDIINFDLRKNFIPISSDSEVFNAAISAATARIYPHLLAAFRLFENEPITGYLFRLKFKRKTAEHGWTEQGISGSRRTEIDNEDGLNAEFLATMEKFKGEREPGTRELRTKNYLEGQQTLLICGFTLEASQKIDYEK